MNRMATLIRVRRWELDEARRKVTDLEALAETLALRIAALDAGIAAEARLAASSLEASFSFAAYSEAAALQRENLVRSQHTVLAQVEEARDALAAAFQEVKKFEIALENRRTRANQELARREGQALDEAAIESFRRSSGNG